MANGGGRTFGPLALIIAGAIPVLLDPGAIARGAELVRLAAGPSPYFVAESRILLYLWIPIVTLSAFVLVLGPGLLLARGFGLGQRVSTWLLTGLALGTLVLSLATETAEAVVGGPLLGRDFAALAMALSVVAALVAWKFGSPEEPSEAPRESRRALCSAVVMTAAILVALLPKFLWESFNGDGAHAYEAARLLLHQPFPFWPRAAGDVSLYPGVTTAISSYPVAWFIRLFGEVEAAARIPYLLFLAGGLFPSLLRAVEIDREEQVGPATPWLVWAGLVGFTLAMAFSATHNPYHADIALPGAQDALLMAWFLGFAAAFVEGSGWRMALFGTLTYGTSPAGLILLGLWLGATFTFLRPLPIRALLWTTALLVAFVVAGRLAPRAFALLGQPGPGGEHRAGGLIGRLLETQLTDWRRIYFMVIPCGVVPVLALLLWRRMDRLTRAFAVLGVAQFLFFYFQRRTSLHYFVPAMVLPIAVCWRLWPDRVTGRAFPIAAALGALLAVWLGLPARTAPHLAAREVGARLAVEGSDYARSGPVAFRRSEILTDLFPRDRGPGVPDSAYGGSPLSWLYYAHRLPSGTKVYRLQGSTDPPPAGGRLIADAEGAAVWSLDDEVLARDREQRLPHGIARVYHLTKFSDHTAR